MHQVASIILNLRKYAVYINILVIENIFYQILYYISLEKHTKKKLQVNLGIAR